ncbi:Ferric-chelate reductase 1 [Orchesella cincta]|uniref:ascorbate ferrireductase (transmembrane) n=1 Tax=Orchesella cincta TaxID=48709 RepID=A0A1D2NMG5_ORCCI|nr:Ferric-chelate reductase 1 [Orchesella cincta]
MRASAPSPQGPPLPPRTTLPFYEKFPEAKPCYEPSPATPPSHSAGNNPNWAILEHLVRHKAQSFQPYDDLPYVYPYIYGSGPASPIDRSIHLNYGPEVDIISPPLPRPNAPNPYFVEVTGISFKGELLHNFLHFRIFANMSVALGKGQVERTEFLHRTEDVETPNYATGKISALVIMVKDQNGWPVGDFSTPVPCLRTCSKYSHDVYYGDERNAVPCSYTPPHASSHPGMFVFDVDPGRYCTSDLPETKGGAAVPASTDPDPRMNPQTARLEGVREVHATWSFGHNTCNFVQRLYIQTLIFEDVETVYPGWFDPKPNDINYGPPEPGKPPKMFPETKASFLFGWTAQYNILKPTRSSLGAPDYVNLKYLRERDARVHEVDCHVPLFDAVKTVPSAFRKFVVPAHETLHDPVLTAIEQAEMAVPTRSGYNAALWKIFKESKDASADNAVRYFGQNTRTTEKCKTFPSTLIVEDNVKKILGSANPPSAKVFFEHKKQDGIRCPCPALASTLPPENRTADPARVHGRLIHASHMAIAYMLLTPIGCFVARYYKETFVSIFCFQEYWWFMWHVVFLIAACLFNIGAITSIARKKQLDLKYNDNLIFHVVFGALSIFVFYMEIITGFFRVADSKKRMRQIFMHWLIGTMNNACAVMSMFAMAFVNQSGFSCNVAYATIFWLFFVITCYSLMEVNMRKTDRSLHLVPRRTYLPPPVKRLFTKEPPGRNFRLGMLAVFIFGLIGIQFLVSYYIWDTVNTGGASCQEEWEAYRPKVISNYGGTGGGGGGGGGAGGYYYG